MKPWAQSPALRKLGLVMCGCNPRIWEVKAGGLEVHVSLGCIVGLRPAFVTRDYNSKRTGKHANKG